MSRLAAFLLFCFYLLTLAVAVPLRGHPHLKHIVRQTCPLSGFPFGDTLIGCKSFKDLISAGTSALTDELANPFESTTLADSDVQNINDKFVQPAAEALNAIVESALNSNQAPSFLDSNICLGNFDGGFAFDDYEGACATLPLKDGEEWTVFGFALEIGPSSPFKALCPGVDGDGTFASFCVGVTKDCKSKPSIVVSLTPDLFKCQPFDAILATSTAGASEIIIGGLGAVVDSYTFGLSTTNSFEREFTTFNGDKIIEFAAPGSMYTSGAFSLATDTIPNVPEFFKFSGEAVKMINIDGVEEAVSKTVKEFRKTPKDPEAALGSLKKVLSQVEFGILYNINLNMQFAFSELGKLGSVLPDSEEFEIGDASIYATTSTVNDGTNSLKPGLYMYTSTSPGAIIKAFLKYALTFAGEILNGIPDWVPIDIDATTLADKINISGGSDDFAVSFVTIVPEAKAVFMVRAPLIVKELGFIQLKCSIDLDDDSFKCQVKSNFGEKIFAAIGEALEDGVMWIAKELEDFGEDFVDAGEEILAAGISILGDAADAFGSAFSTKTIDSTLKALGNELVNLNFLNDGYQISAWATKAGEGITEIFEDTWDEVATGVKAAGELGEDIIKEAKDFFTTSEEDVNKFSGQLADALGCSKANTRKSIEDRCQSCCRRAYNLVGTLRDADDALEKATKTIIKEVGNFIEETVEDVLSKLGLVKSSTSIKKSSTGKYDSYSNCLIYAYHEEGTKTVGFWPFQTKVPTKTHLYDAPDESCVKAALEKVIDVQGAIKAMQQAGAVYNSVKTKLAASIKAASLTKAQLLSSGVTCSTDMKTSEGKNEKLKIPIGGFPFRNKFKIIERYLVPVEITCKAPEILANGNLSSGLSTITVNHKIAIDKSSQSSAMKDLRIAESDARAKLIDLISAHVATSRR